MWHPAIVETQILRLGQMIILAVPAEFSTMAGRRLREQVAQEAQQFGSGDVKVVIAGLSNVYAHYVTTFEEYQVNLFCEVNNK
jgi:neutral ceramidase